MKSSINPHRILTGFLFTMVLTQIESCKKFVEIEPPSTRIEAIKIFSNEEAALSAVNGLYSMIGMANMNFLNGGITLYTSLSGDELFNTSPSADADPFNSNSLTSIHQNLYNRLWKPAYNNNYIYTANAIIESLSSSKSLSDSLKNQLLGETKVIRALGYFYLINLFGNVPLVTSTDFEQNAKLPRTPVDKIYEFIIADLKEAKDLMKPNYPLTNRTRINKWTAASLLSRLYLNTKSWSEAETEASEVINSGMYGLNSNLNNVFNSIASNETIWQLGRDGNNTFEGAAFIPASATSKPPYALTSNLMEAFAPQDLRRIKWIGKNTVNGQDYYYPYKYKSRLSNQSLEYYIIFRLAEQVLIRAEARAYLNNISGAQEDLNLIRSRAGLTGIATANKDTVIQSIQNERRLEFFCEIGQRWLDLKRTNKADEVLSALKFPNWQSTDVLYPIPQIELDKNPSLVQNPGY